MTLRIVIEVLKIDDKSSYTLFAHCMGYFASMDPTISFFSTCSVSHGMWSENKVFAEDCFQEKVFTPNPFGLSDTLSVFDPDDRVLILARSCNTEIYKSYKSVLAAESSVFTSLILVGDELIEPEYIASLLQNFIHGGFLFPQVVSIPQLNDAIECIDRHFFNSPLSELQQRKQYSRGSDHQHILVDQYFPPLLPTSCVEEALFQSDWKWTRGLRMFREHFRGIKDVVVFDSGPVGLELTRTTESWIVSGTHPPVSAIGLPIGSRIVGINNYAITINVSTQRLHQLMNMRPVCVTIQTRDVQDNTGACIYESRVNYPLIEEVSSFLLCHRSKNPYRTIPTPFRFSTPRPWKKVECPLVIACVVMLEDVCLGRVGLTNRLNSRRASNSRLWRYIQRRRSIAKPFGQHLSFKVDKQFVYQLDATTPACFAHCREFTKYLRAEGINLEILFVKLVADVAHSNNSQLKCIYTNEGPSSIMWIRIFLVLLNDFGKRMGNSGDIFADAMKCLCASQITELVIRNACNIGVNRKWVQEWHSSENR